MRSYRGARLKKYGLKHPSYSSLAQSVERMTVNHDVAGSSPAGGAKKKAGRKTCLFLGSLVVLVLTT